VTRKVDLSLIPLYDRARAILPIDPIRQYVAEKVKGPTTLKIHSGKDGEYRLYEDDGTSLDYLQGKCCWRRITWDNAKRRLTIEPVEGSAKAAAQTFEVEVVPDGRKETIRFTGEKITVGL
jgi:alpha-glucosidase (family GH31 glycosyl hydrolase)